MNKMKTLRLFVLSIGIVITTLTFNSCLDDDDYNNGNQWLTVATVESKSNSNSAHYFRLDDGVKLLPATGNYTGHNLEDGHRVLLNYTVISDSDDASDTHYVRVNDLSVVLTKDIAENKSEENDSIYGTDPVNIQKMWIGGGYLNILFETQYGNFVKHFINLIPKTDAESPYVYEFRHNRHKDPANFWSNGVVCFNFSEIDTEGQTITITILVNTYNGEKEYTFEYNSDKKDTPQEPIPSDTGSGYIDRIK